MALPDAPSARIACVSYAPFRNAGETPLDAQAFISPERIDEDLRALSQRFDCVRTYSQGQGLSAVPQIAERYGMKVLMGIWLGSDKKANAQQIELGIATARKYPQVLRGVIVGNEVLLRGDLSAKQLDGYLREVRAAVSVPVTYADVWEFWLRHPELAGSVDYLTIHILPYWEDQPVSPERAVQHVATVYAKVQQAFPGRRVMIGETGWPSAGRPRQAASASLVNEARYLREFLVYAADRADAVQRDRGVRPAVEACAGRHRRRLLGHLRCAGAAEVRDAGAGHRRATLVGRLARGRDRCGAVRAGRRMAAALDGLARLAGLTLSGFASGCALAWQFRQMLFACRDRGNGRSR